MSLQRFKQALQNGASLANAADASVLWKKDSSPPDYTPMAEASKEAAKIMADLGYAELDFAKLAYDETKPLLFDIGNTQVDAMRQSLAQGEDYYNYMKNTYRPVEQKLVAEAERFNTEAERNRLSREAAGTYEQQAAIQKDAQMRQMASMGVNPNSGRAMATRNAMGLQGAAARAGLMTNAREQAKNVGYARMMDAAGLGRNLPGASAGAYQLATGAGNAAGANFQAPGTQLMQGNAMGVNTIGSGQQMKVQGLSNVLNAQTQMAISDNNQSSPFGAILGAGLNYFMGSSKDFKYKIEDIDPISVSYKFEKLDIDRWKYKEGYADEREHIGPYAEDVQELGMGDGKMVDLLSMIGMTMAAVQGIAQRLAKLEEKLW